jgi:hypothetical protein
VKTNGKEILIHIVSEKYATKRHRIPVMHKVQKQLLVLNRNLQPEIFTGIIKKMPLSNPSAGQELKRAVLKSSVWWYHL